MPDEKITLGSHGHLCSGKPHTVVLATHRTDKREVTMLEIRIGGGILDVFGWKNKTKLRVLEGFGEDANTIAICSATIQSKGWMLDFYSTKDPNGRLYLPLAMFRHHQVLSPDPAPKACLYSPEPPYLKVVLPRWFGHISGHDAISGTGLARGSGAK